MYIGPMPLLNRPVRTAFPVICITLLMAACATPVRKAASPTAAPDATSPSALVLGAEVALQRGDYVEAARAYSRAAQGADDEVLAEQATRVAYDHEQTRYVLASAERWLEINPTSEEGQRFAAFAALRLYRIEDAAKHFTALLETGFINPQAGFLALLPQLMDEGSRPAVAATLGKLVERFPNNAEAHYALGQAAAQADNLSLALKEALRAHELSPYWGPAGFLLARLQMSSGEIDNAIATARAVVEQDGRAQNRLEFAVLRLAAGQDEQARADLSALAASEGDTAGAERALAISDYQVGKFDLAAQRFGRLLSSGRFVYESLFYLGNIAERRGATDEAGRFYSKVVGGDYAMAAQTRAARLKLAAGSLSEALTLLQEFGQAHSEYMLDSIAARSNLLAESGDRNGALALLDTALQDYPDAYSLRFAKAFLLVNMDRIRDAIAVMQALVNDRPDDPTALNALGYTLVDRTRRYDEGYQLVRRAYEQTPDSGAVLDSMGWALFRMGKKKEALDYLERARMQLHDAELELHLGDVLWELGRREDAHATWQAAAMQYPKDTDLQDRLKRFKGK
jgi:tetratricopeptide (TPR) repeat protein